MNDSPTPQLASSSIGVPLSILDLATVRAEDGPGAIAQTFSASVELARAAQEWGFHRYWFAEHHNMSTIASSATAVLIGHVAGKTSRIRVGAGGIMLPNHSPLVIAEQFGTLETLYPGRIDLGLGRAPGGDGAMLRALRRSREDADRFPADVAELQAFLGPQQADQEVTATPGAGTEVPLYILGSSLFGAQLAAAMGLPYAFASHFAPAALVDAVETYRRDYRASARHPEPYVIAALNVFAADTEQAAGELYRAALRDMIARLARPGVSLSGADAEALLETPGGRRVQEMLRYAAIGSPEGGERGTLHEQVDSFARLARADEVIVVSNTPTAAQRFRSYELLAAALGLGA